MIRKLGFIKILLLVTGLLFFRPSFAQQGKNKSILLTALLEKISNTHKVFFTYDANLLSDKYIQEKGFTNLSLSASISLLKKLTSFLVDDLGNNYYVVYPEKIITKNDINPKTKTNKY